MCVVEFLGLEVPCRRKACSSGVCCCHLRHPETGQRPTTRSVAVVSRLCRHPAPDTTAPAVGMWTTAFILLSAAAGVHGGWGGSSRGDARGGRSFKKDYGLSSDKMRAWGADDTSSHWREELWRADGTGYWTSSYHGTRWGSELICCFVFFNVLRLRYRFRETLASAPDSSSPSHPTDPRRRDCSLALLSGHVASDLRHHAQLFFGFAVRACCE